MRLAVGLLIAAALGWVSASQASVGDGWRWPRYDKSPVKLHVVTDQGFDRAQLPALKAAAKDWEQSGVLRFDFPKPVTDCDRDAQKQNTICVTSGDFWDAPWNSMGGWSWQALLRPGLDGNRLMAYARLWINTIYKDDTTPLPHWSQHTFCHELGHNIGLGHTEDGPWTGELSCMANDFGYYSYKPSADDLAFVRTLYAIRDVR